MSHLDRIVNGLTNTAMDAATRGAAGLHAR